MKKKSDSEPIRSKDTPDITTAISGKTIGFVSIKDSDPFDLHKLVISFRDGSKIVFAYDYLESWELIEPK